MQLRFSTCRGTPVCDEHTGELYGAIDGILLHPDTGVVEGFFLATQGMFAKEPAFLRSADIRRWGKRVEVRDDDSIGPIHEHIRLEHLSKDPRRMLGQRMVTEQGEVLGRLADVQFDTTTFHLQWLFPRKFRLFWGIAVPASAVLEVKKHAIIIRNQEITVKDTEVTPELVPTPPTPA